MYIDIISLFPDYFIGPFHESIIKRARDKGLLNINLIDLREFAEGKHRRVDDRPYGGGPGMLLMPGPVTKAIRYAKNRRQEANKDGVSVNDKAHVIYLSPQGKKLTAEKSRDLTLYKHLILLCGHYEGVDERALNLEVDEEISIGDYVLTDGCLPAIVLVNAMARFVPGVLGNEDTAAEDSFEDGIYDCPHYTKPVEFENRVVPDVLQTGDHSKIKQWRYSQSLNKKAKVRPDLFVEHFSDYSRTGSRTGSRTSSKPDSPDSASSSIACNIVEKGTKEYGPVSKAELVPQLLVKKLDASIKLYCDLLGWSIAQENDCSALLTFASDKNEQNKNEQNKNQQNKFGHAKIRLVRASLDENCVDTLTYMELRLGSGDFEALIKRLGNDRNRSRKKEVLNITIDDTRVVLNDLDGHIWSVVLQK